MTAASNSSSNMGGLPRPDMGAQPHLGASTLPVVRTSEAQMPVLYESIAGGASSSPSGIASRRYRSGGDRRDHGCDARHPLKSGTFRAVNVLIKFSDVGSIDIARALLAGRGV